MAWDGGVAPWWRGSCGCIEVPLLLFLAGWPASLCCNFYAAVMDKEQYASVGLAEEVEAEQTIAPKNRLHAPFA